MTLALRQVTFKKRLQKSRRGLLNAEILLNESAKYYVTGAMQRDCQSFTAGASALTFGVTSFMTAVRERKSGSKQCLTQAAFLPSAASMQIRVLELFVHFQHSTAAISPSAKTKEMGLHVDGFKWED